MSSLSSEFIAFMTLELKTFQMIVKHSIFITKLNLYIDYQNLILDFNEILVFF